MHRYSQLFFQFHSFVDHKELMKRIEALLPQIFALNNINTTKNDHDTIDSNVVNISQSSSSSSSSTTTNNNCSTTTQDIENLKKFAKIDQVLQDSPAFLGGICDGDHLLSFGAITAENINPFNLIPETLKQHVNKSLTIIVLRDGSERVSEYMTLTIYPKTWSGRGVLGCHFTPIS